MRHRHIVSTYAMVSADPVTLAKEYLSAKGPGEHEFRSDRGRDEWANLVFAFGSYAHGERFQKACGDLAPSIPEIRQRPVCERCGSVELSRDANAAWDPDQQAWVLTGTYDCHYCATCGREGDDIARWEPITESLASSEAEDIAAPIMETPSC